MAIVDFPSNPSAGQTYTFNSIVYTYTTSGVWQAGTVAATQLGPTGTTGPAGAAGSGATVTPQGRLTLQSTAPVQTANQTAKGTIYYDSYVGNQVPVYNGSSWTSLTITGDEISMGLDTGVPHVASGSLYDIFAVSNSGSLAICIGPAWSSTTSRGAGAGTTELQLQSGIWTNKNALTHAWGGASGTTDYGSVSANQATYLGTFYATANGQTGVALKPAAASGGSNTFVGLYNGYNRVAATAWSQDNTVSWTYALTTWRAANGNNSNRVSFVDGLQQTLIQGMYQVTGSGNVATVGVNLDSTSATPNIMQDVSLTANITGMNVQETWFPQLGFHYIQAMEMSAQGATTTFFAAATPPARQLQALTVSLSI